VRAALAPLAVAQARASAGVAAAAAAARRAGSDPARPAALLAALAAHRAASPPALSHPGWLVAAPLAQLPVLVTAVLAVRRLATEAGAPLRHGGALWFPDLTLPAVDAGALLAPMGAAGALLPAAAALLTCANVQRAFSPPPGAPPLPRAAAHLKLALEWLVVPALVAALTQPHALLCYWVPSAAASLALGTALRRAVRGSPTGRAPPEAARLLLQQAAAHRAAGRLEPAALAAAAARVAAPEEPSAAFAAGQLAAKLAQWGPSAAAYSEAVRLWGTSQPEQRGRALFGLGVARAMQAKEGGPAELRDAAIAAFQAAAAARPADARPLLALAAELRRAGRLPEARAAAEAAMALDAAAAPLLAELTEGK